MNIENCSSCGEQITKMGFAVTLDVNTFVQDDSIDDKMFKSIPNGSFNNKEILCKECFDKFVEKINLNQ